MRRIIICALVALTALGGVASADRARGGGRGRPQFNDHRSGGVSVHTSRYQGRGHYVQRPAVRIVRRPIYVQRPVIRYRYYRYDRRPTVITENYSAMPGYYWVAGQWYWSGAEWLWNPGHYEPDPNYQTYDQSYDYPQYESNYGY